MVRNSIVTLALLCAIVFAARQGIAQEAPQIPSTVSQEDGAVKKAVEVKPAADDTSIANRIQRILESTDWYQNPRVSVREGVVFINGETKLQEHWRWASALAENTQGAVAVVNRIEVNADVGSTFGRAGDELVRIYRQALQAWPWVLIAAVILMTTWIVARMVAYLARRFFANRISSSILRGFVTRLFSIPIYLLGFYFVLQVAGLTRLALTVLGGTGLFGIIVGFAFRDIAENFLASLLLSLRNPFKTGDLIEVNGNTGVVQNLNVRSTVLLTLDGNYVQIPNAIVFKTTITNYSSTPSRRADFSVGISYESSATKAQALIAEVLKQHPAVLEAPEPLVLIEELGMATVNLRIYYWFVSATYSPIKINSALLRLTKDALLEGGIELPDAAREVIFPKGLPIGNIEDISPQARRTEPKPRVDLELAGRPATVGEGDLSNDTAKVTKHSNRHAPESKENLLKG